MAINLFSNQFEEKSGKAASVFVGFLFFFSVTAIILGEQYYNLFSNIYFGDC